MAESESDISTKRAGLLLGICGLLAVGLFVMLHFLASTPEPLHRKVKRGEDIPIQQRFNTDPLGKQKRLPPPAGTPAPVQPPPPPASRPGLTL